MNRDPHTSVRDIARETGISKTSVHPIMQEHKFHPYRIHLHQKLEEGDFQGRVEFCRFALMAVRNDRYFMQKVLFTDESTFTNSGQVNLRNMHYWTTENPRWLREVEHQRKWKVNVWCGIIGDFIVGPYFFQGTLIGRSYATFLRETLPVLLEEIPLSARQGMWFQHDGCPAHYAKVSRAVLNDAYKYHDRWIGRGGIVRWTARSPDLTPLDFFLWGKIKGVVYATVPTTPEDMQRRIVAACGRITQETLQSVRRSLETRLQMCIAVDGGHIEHMM